MRITQVKIALCQLDVGTDKQANIETATKAVKVRTCRLHSRMRDHLCVEGFWQTHCDVRAVLCWVARYHSAS